MKVTVISNDLNIDKSQISINKADIDSKDRVEIAYKIAFDYWAKSWNLLGLLISLIGGYRGER